MIDYNRFEWAEGVSIEIDRDTQIATLHFQVARKPDLTVTIPLQHLHRLHDEIGDALRRYQQQSAPAKGRNQNIDRE